VVLAISAGLALNAQAPRTSGLRPGHLIKGIVKDTAGRPVADVFISALERDETRDVRADGQVPERPYRMVSARVGAVTDSNGRYELELPFAGEFYLVALPRHTAKRGARGIA
jgi:hypothetical protein